MRRINNAALDILSQCEHRSARARAASTILDIAIDQRAVSLLQLSRSVRIKAQQLACQT